jgi:plastocyanin
VRRTLAVAFAAILAFAISTPQAQAQAFAAVAFNRFATPVVVVARTDQPVLFVNGDIEYHNVQASDATRPDGSAPWCFGRAPGTCPLFWSQLTGTGTTEVLGLQDAEPGVVYRFVCAPHEFMTGELIVAPQGGYR